MMRLIRSFLRDRSGNVLMLTGLAVLILFAVGGAGVDFGRQQLVRLKLQNASDAAAVAAASLPPSASEAQRRQMALRYYNLNFPASYLGIARPSPNIQLGDQIIVDASTSVTTNFVRNVGVESLAVGGRTVVDRTEPQRAIYDVILVMDNSGSMADSATAPAYALTPSGSRGSARTLSLAVCRNEILPQFNVACQPGQNQFTLPDGRRYNYGNRSVCINNGPRDYCNTALDGENTVVSTPNGNIERPGFSFIGNTRLNALRAVALDFVTRIIDEGEAGSRIGVVTYATNLGANRPLTTDAESVRLSINTMAAYGATNPAVGMQAANSTAGNFAADHVKAVVFLTDGTPTTTGRNITYITNPRTGGLEARDADGCNLRDFCAPTVTQTTSLCDQLKNSGTRVYTVAFGPEVSSGNVQNFLRSCASVNAEGEAEFYNAPTAEELDRAFDQILTSLGRIRIAQ